MARREGSLSSLGRPSCGKGGVGNPHVDIPREIWVKSGWRTLVVELPAATSGPTSWAVRLLNACRAWVFGDIV
jgi:hypothetical protein